MDISSKERLAAGIAGLIATRGCVASGVNIEATKMWLAVLI